MADPTGIPFVDFKITGSSGVSFLPLINFEHKVTSLENFEYLYVINTNMYKLPVVFSLKTSNGR